MSEGPEGTRCCYKCRLFKSNGFGTGRGKKTWVCLDCNSLEARIRRLTEGKAIQKMWKDMDPDEKISWRAEHSALEGACLKDQLSVTFTQKILQEESTKSGELGEYLPLCVYKTNCRIEDNGLTTYVCPEGALRRQ